MILSGSSIKASVGRGDIMISPFCEDQVNPNSYDFRLGEKILEYKEHVLDSARDNPTVESVIPRTGLLLESDRIYLGHTFETMGSKVYVPIIRAKSSIARLGLFIHVTADLIDIGSVNQWTLQLHAVQPVVIYPHMLIGQVTFWEVRGAVDLYRGKYQHSRGPMPSQSYRDF